MFMIDEIRAAGASSKQARASAGRVGSIDKVGPQTQRRADRAADIPCVVDFSHDVGRAFRQTVNFDSRMCPHFRGMAGNGRRHEGGIPPGGGQQRRGMDKGRIARRLGRLNEQDPAT
jgi:hypothetical protein